MNLHNLQRIRALTFDLKVAAQQIESQSNYTATEYAVAE